MNPRGLFGHRLSRPAPWAARAPRLPLISLVVVVGFVFSWRVFIGVWGVLLLFVFFWGGCWVWL